MADLPHENQISILAVLAVFYILAPVCINHFLQRLVSSTCFVSRKFKFIRFPTLILEDIYWFYSKKEWEKKSNSSTYSNDHCVKSVQIRNYFWSLFSCTRTEYGDLRSRSLYSVRIQENADQKYSVFGHFLRSGLLSIWIFSISYNKFLTQSHF